MEYIKVIFEEDRAVFVGGVETARTNRKFRIGEGTHTIKLEDPQDYAPRWRRPTVTGTSPLKPMMVKFDLL